MEQKPNYYAILPANVRYSQELSANEKLFFAEITALANQKGYCHAKDAYFAELFGIHQKSVNRIIGKLAKKFFVKIEKIYDGKEIKERRIFITTPSNPNVTTYQPEGYHPSNPNVTTPSNPNVTDNNTRKNTTRRILQEEQSKVENSSQDLNIEEKKETEIDFLFEEFWKEYPKARRVGKDGARKKFISILKNKEATAQDLIAGARNYRLINEKNKTEDRFIKHPTSWLHNGRWKDEVDIPTASTLPENWKEIGRQMGGFFFAAAGESDENWEKRTIAARKVGLDKVWDVQKQKWTVSDSEIRAIFKRYDTEFAA